MARIVGNDAANITQASLSAITRYVYNITDLTEAITNLQSSSDGGAGMTIASHVYDTLQTDSKWDTDTTGYNFAYSVPAEELPEGNQTYRFEFIFEPVSGEEFPVVFEIETKPLASR